MEAERYEQAKPMATCPYCYASIRLQVGSFTLVQRGGCAHVARIEKFDGTYWVVFGGQDASAKRSNPFTTEHRK